MSRRRVLIVRVGAMGDVLHALPAVAALRKAWPDAEIDWVVDPRWSALLAAECEPPPVVSQVHLAETRLWSHAPLSAGTLRSIQNLRRALRARRYDDVVDLQGTLRSGVIARLSGARSVSGFADPRESAARWLYTRRLQRQGVHVVDQGAALLGGALGLRLTASTPELPRDAAAVAWANKTLAATEARPLALLAPTAGWGAKQWPPERFAALARTLAGRGWAVRINTAQALDPVSKAVVSASDGTAQGICSSVSGLVELVRRAALVVGGDTGPIHLAAALGRPVVGLYGPTDPARNGPWGPGPTVIVRHPESVTSHKRTSAVERGLARISVDQVVEAAEAVAPALRR